MTNMVINLLNEYFKNRSQDQNKTELMNWYLEIENPNVQASYMTGGEVAQHGKYKSIAIPTPGLTAFNSGSGSVVRAAITHKGIPYFVVDNTFYSYASDGTRTSRGTLSTSSGTVRIARINDQIAMVDGTSMYVYTVSTATFTTVVDVDAPTSPTMITAQDEYFIVSKANSITLNSSNLASGTAWEALDFASKNGGGDSIVQIISNQRYLWVLGTSSSEVWYNDGGTNFPLTPYPNLYMEFGCAAAESVAKGDNNVFFIAQSPTGGYQVVHTEGLQLQVVSNNAVEYQLSQASTLSDATAYVYKQSGHEFYVLTLPTAGVTLAYDLKTKLWHQRQSLVSGVQTRHIASCYAFAYNKCLVGAYNSGTISYYDEAAYTENGSAITRYLITPPAYAAGKKMYLDRLQVDTETGVGSSLTMTLDVSYNSGHTFTNSLTGTIPDSGGRMFWTRLGYTQNAFVIKLSTSVAANCTLLGATAEARVGVH